MPDDSFRFVSAADGMSIQAYVWRTVGAPRASVVIAHGAAEHALRYERFARALGAAELEVWALDHRGHGRSSGTAGLGDAGQAGWDGLVSDLGQLIGLAREAHPGLATALFAHSMGSFAAQQLCPEQSAIIDALILSGSTVLEIPEDGGARLRFDFNAAFEPARTRYDWLSRDDAEVDRYIADPLCGFESQQGRGIFDAAAMRSVADSDAPRRIRPDLPVLLLAGDADPINQKLEGLKRLRQRWLDAGLARIDERYYAEGRHEMLNETNHEAVTRDIISWLGEALEL